MLFGIVCPNHLVIILSSKLTRISFVFFILYHIPQIPNLKHEVLRHTGYCGTSEIEHGLCACTIDNPLAKARGLSLRPGAQTMLYLSLNDPEK